MRERNGKGNANGRPFHPSTYGEVLPQATDTNHLPAGKPALHSGTGHRQRLRDRLLTGGAEALAGARRQGDTKVLAKRLLDRFGSLGAVLDADPAALAEVKGMGQASAATLKATALAARRMARSKVQDKPVLGSWQALLDYLSIDMANLTVERVRVLYLDTRNRLIRDHHVGDGSVDEAAIHPREVIRRGLDVGATALILVHNHPSGNSEPSRADIQITQRIAEAGRLLGITVHDHVIVGREGHTSLRAKGLI